MAQIQCAIEGCDRPQHTREWCFMHYHRWIRHGTTDLIPRAKPRKPCSFEGCSNLARGPKVSWCSTHYARVLRHGDATVNLLPQRTKGTLEERYWRLVDKRGPDECWPWQGKVDDTGYGRMTGDGHREYAHRIGYRLAYGEIAYALTIDHTCHNKDKTCWLDNTCPHRACQNPAHLEAVGRGINVNRGRRRDQRPSSSS